MTRECYNPIGIRTLENNRLYSKIDEEILQIKPKNGQFRLQNGRFLA